MLGIISTDPEINRTINVSRGLGIVPNDYDLSTIRQFLPLHHGWVVGQNRTSWGSTLGQTTEESQVEIAQALLKQDKIRTWAAVISSIASVGITVAILISLRRG